MNVFIVEDEPIVLLGFEKMVSEAGYVVVGTSANGASAVKQILTVKPDVMMVDINLPDMDGFSVIEAVQKEQDIPAIVITGYKDENVVNRVTKSGIFGFLHKPVDQFEIASALSIAEARNKERFEAQRARREAETARDLATAKLAERKVIERAKALLMAQFAIGDEEAMRFMQRKSRNSNQKLFVVASEILRKGELLK